VSGKTLIISNYDPATDLAVFENDRGHWNVSRALRDCAAGKHKRYLIDVSKAYKNNAAIEVDNGKVASLVAAFIAGGECPPLLGIIEDGAMWLIDGHHRLRALRHIGVKEFAAYIIEEADSAPYKIWYNGQRKPPFKV
jgi:hypothetical protein